MRAFGWVSIGLLAMGCVTQRGAFWDDDDQCWRSGVAWRRPAISVSCDDIVIAAEDRRGDCWVLSCLPADTPPAWNFGTEAICEQVPTAELEAQVFGEGDATLCE